MRTVPSAYVTAAAITVMDNGHRCRGAVRRDPLSIGPGLFRARARARAALGRPTNFRRPALS